MIWKRRFVKLWGLAVALAMVLLASRCSGFFPGRDTVVSLSISPNSPFILPQHTQQFTATATFGDNSTGDVSSSVTWTSSVPTIATIDTSGLATGVALGTTTITARSSNNVTANVTLTVSNRTVTSLTISPPSATITLSLGQTNQQFMASANFSDGSTGVDVTNQATWTSSNSSVATINSNGLATARTTGFASIGASYGGTSATAASLTVQ